MTGKAKKNVEGLPRCAANPRLRRGRAISWKRPFRCQAGQTVHFTARGPTRVTHNRLPLPITQNALLQILSARSKAAFATAGPRIQVEARADMRSCMTTGSSLRSPSTLTRLRRTNMWCASSCFCEVGRGGHDCRCSRVSLLTSAPPQTHRQGIGRRVRASYSGRRWSCKRSLFCWCWLFPSTPAP
jgi:hypothetical protein